MITGRPSDSGELQEMKGIFAIIKVELFDNQDSCVPIPVHYFTYRKDRPSAGFITPARNTSYRSRKKK
jgi:hypothetical protein